MAKNTGVRKLIVFLASLVLLSTDSVLYVKRTYMNTGTMLIKLANLVRIEQAKKKPAIVKFAL